MEEKRKIYIGIDYGTTRSAAGILKELNGEVDLFKWDDAPSNASSLYKSPTVSLYDKKINKCIAISHTANSAFADKKPEDVFLLIQWPKKHLQEKEIKGIPTIEVVATYLQMLNIKLVKNLGLQGFRDIDITYALTVPAIWNVDQKLLMRRAAHKAKLIDQENSDKLIIVLEPEAAAAEFIHYMAKAKLGDTDGKNVLVVDAGGGTVDLAALRINEGDMEELCPGIGNQKGSSYINEKIIKDLATFFNSDTFESWKNGGVTKKNTAVSFMDKLESTKCLLKSYEEKSIPLPRQLIKSILEEPPKGWPTAGRLKLIWDDDDFDMVITKEGWKYYFSDALEDAGKLTSEMISRIKSINSTVDYVWLVGGFSGSVLLQNEIMDKCKGRITYQVLTPPNPETAIVSGSLKFGQKPNTIIGRSMRESIGVEIIEDWDDKKHTSELWVHPETGKKYSRHIYHELVKVGDHIKEDESVKIYPSVVHENQRIIDILFYQAPQGTTYITSSQKAELKGQILISLPNTESNANRKVCLEVFFGKSERKAIAYNESDPSKKYEVTLEGTRKKKKVQYHVIFVIDHSGSMNDPDVTPDDPEYASNTNRLGCVFEACGSFLKCRMENNPVLSTKNEAGPVPTVKSFPRGARPSPILKVNPDQVQKESDIYSMIKFDHRASVVFEKEKLSPTIKNHFNFRPDGGTNYQIALNLIKPYLLDDTLKHYIPMIIFLSDGEDSNNPVVTLEALNELKNLSSSLIFNTIHFGAGSGADLLKEMANIGNGLFVPVGASLDKLIQTFELMAMKL